MNDETKPETSRHFRLFAFDDWRDYLPWILTLIIIAAALFQLHLQGRIGWCKWDAPYDIWSSDAWGKHNSQHFFDPYTFTHVLHGFLYFWFLKLDFRQTNFTKMAAFYRRRCGKRVGNFGKYQLRHRTLPHGNARARVFRRLDSEFFWRHFKLRLWFHHRPQTRLLAFINFVCFNRNRLDFLDSRQSFNQHYSTYSSN